MSIQLEEFRMHMRASQYLKSVLDREAIGPAVVSRLRLLQMQLMPVIRDWAGDALVSVQASGSFAKGTANLSGTDIDLFISLSERTSESLEEIFESLFSRMKNSGYSPCRQNVSVNIRTGNFSVDLVPAKRQNSFSSDHSLYRRKARSWTKTNVAQHIAHVRNAGRSDEIRALKLWRNQKRLDFPSFYLELVVIKALVGRPSPFLSQKVQSVFEFLRDSFVDARFIDPANSNNVISEDLTLAEKRIISSAAKSSREAQYWEQIVA